MKKNFKITSLTAAALASVVLANANFNNNVKAADAAQSEKTAAAKKEQSPEEQAKSNIDNAQKEVNDTQKSVDSSKADLEKAKAEAVKPDQAYQDQKTKTDKANDDAKNKKNVWDDAAKKQADAQKLDDEATPEAINTAKQAVTDKNSEISKKQQDVEKAQAKQGDAQKAVADAEADVSKKQAAVTDAQNAKKNADTQVANAQDALKGTGINEAAKKLKDANTSVKNDEEAISNIKKDIATKTADKTAKSDAKSNVEEAKQTAEQDKQTAQKDYDSKKSISDKANTAVKAKQEEIDKVKSKLNSLKELSQNTINIGDKDAFLQAFVDYGVDNKLSDKDIANINRVRSLNRFIHSESDKHEKVDLNNLTDQQLQEISLFTSDILSKVRNQLGLNVADDQVTDGSIDIAKKIAQRYQDDFKAGKWQGDWHDSYGINDVANKNGLRPNKASDGTLDSVDQPLEDMSSAYYRDTVITMDKLKGDIYDSLLNMILSAGNGITHPGGTPTYEMRHSAGLLGFTIPSVESINNEKETYEFFLNTTKNEKPTYPGGQLIYYEDGNKYTKDEYIDFLNSKIRKLDTKLQQVENKTYRPQKDDIENIQYVAVIPTYFNGADLFTEFHFINISSDQILKNKDSYEKSIPSYKDQIVTATNQITSLSNNLEKLTADAQEKQQQTDLAKSALDQKNQIAQDKLEKFTQANTDYQAAVNALQSAINREQELQDTYRQHQSIQQEAQKRYNTLTASNEEKTRNLETAKEVQTKAAKEVETAKTALDTAKDNLASAKNAQSDLATDIANKQKAVENAQTELVKLQARQSQLKGAHQALVDAKIATQEAKKDYDTANQAAKDAKTQLDALKPAKDAADAKVKDAQDEYDHAVSKLNDAKAKLDHAKQVLYDLEHPAIYLDDASEVQKPQTQKTVNTSNNEVEKTTPTIKKSTSVKIEFIHNSYVYTLQGKIVKRHGKRYLIRKGHKAVALHNAKIVKINGKKFYQIAKNEYVKVVNTVTASKKVNVKAVVKGKKNHKVRTYSSMGKLSRHYVYGQRTYKFTAKKEIKGRTYYKVSGKNEWVPASKLTLK